MVDIDAEGTGGEGIVFFPQRGQDSMPIHHFAFMPTKHQQQITFPGRHMLAIEGLMQSIKRPSIQIENPLFALLKSANAAQDSLHAADENLHGERLRLKIIGAELKGPHLIFAVISGSEHNKRNLRQAMADVFEQFISVHADALQLHQYQIPVALAHQGEAGFSVAHPLRFVSAANEIVAEHRGKADIAVYDQYP